MKQSWEVAENRTWRFWSAQILPHAVCGHQGQSDDSVTDLQMRQQTNAGTHLVTEKRQHLGAANSGQTKLVFL